MMKGPNAPLPAVDILLKECHPRTWNNIPIPLVTTVEMILECLSELKKASHANYNDVVQTQRVVNLNMLAFKRDVKSLKGDIADENTLIALERDRNIEAVIEK